MSDPISVAAAYAVVLGGIALYVASVFRRARETGRVRRVLDAERARDNPEAGVGGPGVAPAVSKAEPAENGR